MIKRINNRGSILLISYLVVIVLTILGGSLIMRSIAENRIALRYSHSNKALWLAEAGVQRGFWELNQNNCAGFTQCDSNPVVSCADCSCANADKCLAGSLGTSGDYDVILNSGNTSMSSTGSYPGRSAANRIQREVAVEIGHNITLTDYAVYVDASLLMAQNSSLIDSYDSSVGSYGLGNMNENAQVASNGYADLPYNVQLADNSTIKGDVRLTPTGTVDITLPATITGSTTRDLSVVELPAVTVPTALQGLTSGGDLLVTPLTPTTLWAGDYKYDSIDIRKADLNIEGDVRIYLTDTVKSLAVGGLTGPGNIKLSSGASLEIYVDGIVEVKYGSAINAVNDKKPANFTLYSTVENTGVSGHSIIMEDSTSAYGVMQSPKGRVLLDKTSSLYGSAAAKSLSLTDSSCLHYDEDLLSLSGGAGGAAYYIISWQENNP